MFASLALFALLCFAPSAMAQSGSSKSASALNTEVGTLWPDNTTGNITPFNARQTLLDIIASFAAGNSIGSGTIGNVNSVWSNSGANIARVSDRLFVGAAAIVNGGNVPESPQDWLNAAGFGTQNAQMVAISTLGLTGVAFASRASDWPSAGVTSNSIGAAFYGFADNTNGTGLHPAWGAYAECDRAASVNAQCLGFESDVGNFGTTVDIAPSAMFPTAGPTVAIWAGCGGVNAGTAPCSAAFTTLSNTQKFRKGIVFGAASLATALGGGGNGVAIEMGVGQSVRWLDTSGNMAAEFYTVISTTSFAHFSAPLNGTFEFDIAGAPSIQIGTGIIYPSTTNTVALGAPSLRYSNGYFVAGNFSGVVTTSLIQPTIVYSAAGTPLPTCNSGNDNLNATVSDATSATYRGAYTSGGAQRAHVTCVNGTGWITD